MPKVVKKKFLISCLVESLGLLFLNLDDRHLAWAHFHLTSDNKRCLAGKPNCSRQILKLTLANLQSVIAFDNLRVSEQVFAS